MSLNGSGQAGVLAVPRPVTITAKVNHLATKKVVLRNSGKGVLTGSVPDIAGLFTVSPPGPFLLNPGKSLSLAISFNPIGAGTVLFPVNITIDSPSQPQPGIVIEVTGIGK
ncbi:MAG TPA: hypothetical protein VMT64_12565 [Candidatus Binataceae bacterium]|nr:hypothetical protein [Candidatus Binataceae bacterium]